VFGPAEGRPVLWLHGTPGARRQVPEDARLAAEQAGVRFIGIDRPGTGLSTSHLYDSILDFTPDLEIVLDELGVGELAVVGLSGGGPYALASAYAMPDRVKVVGVLGGVAPSRGPEGIDGGLVSVAGVLEASQHRRGHGYFDASDGIEGLGRQTVGQDTVDQIHGVGRALAELDDHRLRWSRAGGRAGRGGGQRQRGRSAEDGQYGHRPTPGDPLPRPRYSLEPHTCHFADPS
jgi:pimeloyl-ACP methyl ester carboxylesterase